ncbi:tol-pal system protein YbgF [Ciceribacter ferrooxidans]|uniref:Cell division coordinator CpoB n=1 Tax=Ciceribacter ferrooxidans TaxID=2509717 RepID=A0A4Q2SZH7_9HYPH|nr:tol-pal system protein YbgF [Ciceribacter ferrooxidans]RYC11645.1 tol-pal system protein YbgF [Ciceribacter ferrooxidans]
MKRLAMAAMLATVSLGGLYGTASSMQLMPGIGSSAAQAPAGTNARQPVVLAQSNDASVRVLQLEEEIRALNGRVEEMSYQLLQMQEQIRKFQEDNEFRFQDLEKSKSTKSGALKAPVESGTQQDEVARVITTEPPASAGDPSGAALGTPEQTLGSIELDSSGMPVSASINPGAESGSNLPGVDTPAAAGGAEVASLGSESDVYQVAYGHVLSGDYGLAENEFNDFLSRYPQSRKAADAHFWLGEAQYSQGKFNEAAKTFLNAHQAYGSSPKAPEMLLKLGMSLAALDNTETACATLKEVTRRYPKASRAVVNKVATEQKRLSC